MAYPVKNTTLVQTNSLNSASFALGVNQGGYGLTSVTSFWNGRPPNVSGYTVYVGTGFNTNTVSPKMYFAATDNELITLSNTLGLGTNYNIMMALNSFIYSGVYSVQAVCLNNEPLNIVTNGLVLYFDAGFTPSYPRAYASWFDLSGNQNTGSIINSPAFNPFNSGSLNFNGLNNYVDFFATSLGTTTTVEMWCNITSTISSGMLFGWLYYDVYGYSGSLGYNTANGDVYGLTSTQVTNLGLVGNWVHYIFEMRSDVSYTNNKIYINGVSQTLSQITGVEEPANRNFNSGYGRISGWLSGGSYPVNMLCNSFKVYNRALSASEVLQNYYAGLQRFIPTDGLTLWLDGQNTNTRVITPTIAYDTSVYNNNGVLTNGVTLKHRDAGTVFAFDGVTNYIQVNGTILQDSGGTINVWVKVVTATANGNIMGAAGSGGNRFYIRSNYPPGNFEFIRAANFTITSPSYTLGVWYNLTMTWNSTTFYAYSNGALISSLAYTTLTTNPTVLYLGAQNNTTNFLNGNIAEIQIYDRVLTAAEILTTYTADRGRYGL
jgi:hypothetical protein